MFEEIKGIPRNIADVACGYWHTVIILTDRTLMSCGHNGCGQLGHSDNINRNTFEKNKTCRSFSLTKYITNTLRSREHIYKNHK